MSDLREKVLALAKPYATRAYGAATTDSDYDHLALAVAALVAEECAQECDEAALRFDGLEDSASTRYFADSMRGARNASETLAAAIRRLAERLE